MADVQQVKCSKCGGLYFIIPEDEHGPIWCPTCTENGGMMFDKFAPPLIANEEISVQPDIEIDPNFFIDGPPDEYNA